MTTVDPQQPGDELTTYTDDLLERGIRRIHVLAWRDLDDEDAGGSEIHADEVMRRWAERGLEVLHRTSAARARPATDRRNGYGVVRRGNRYSVFPRAVLGELAGRMGPFDALVEIWNGVPWLGPIWCRHPRLTVVHHVHGPMWGQILPGPVAAFGRALETRLAPPLYRRGITVTPSDGTRDELIGLGFAPDRVTAVPNGVHPRFTPGGERTEYPSVVAVGRLAPVKRLDLVIAAVGVARERIPGLRLTIVGDGPLRGDLDRVVHELGAHEWVEFTGRIDDDELVGRYRRAWLVVSGSLAEGWGLSLTEGAACGTPAVATDIRGHRSSVVDGRTGVLAPPERLGHAIADVLADEALRSRLGEAAAERAGSLTWDAAALGVTEALHRAVVCHGVGRHAR